MKDLAARYPVLSLLIDLAWGRDLGATPCFVNVISPGATCALSLLGGLVLSLLIDVAWGWDLGAVACPISVFRSGATRA